MSFADYLEKILIKRGFWRDGDDCWKEINENGESFEDVISEVGKEYIPEDNEKFDFEVECDHVFDSPGCDIYTVAIAFATTTNNQTEPIAECILYTTYIF